MTSKRSQLLNDALERPDLLSARAALAARNAEVIAIQRQRLPQISLQARRDGVFDSPASTSLRAVASVPIFDFGSLNHEKRAAQSAAKAQNARVAWLQQQSALQVEQGLVRLEQWQATVNRYRLSIVPQSLELLRKTQVGYSAGASNYLEVLEGQRALRQVQSEYLQALTETFTAEVALDAATGKISGLNATIEGSPTTPREDAN